MKFRRILDDNSLTFYKTIHAPTTQPTSHTKSVQLHQARVTKHSKNWNPISIKSTDAVKRTQAAKTLHELNLKLREFSDAKKSTFLQISFTFILESVLMKSVLRNKVQNEVKVRGKSMRVFEHEYRHNPHQVKLISKEKFR